MSRMEEKYCKPNTKILLRESKYLKSPECSLRFCSVYMYTLDNLKINLNHKLSI